MEFISRSKKEEASHRKAKIMRISKEDIVYLIDQLVRGLRT
jgi:hypothetical protein